MSKHNHHYGLDLLRAVSMFMIVILHLLRHGEVHYNAVFGSSRFYASGMLEYFCLISVNCYALLSGYLLFAEKFRLKRIILLWAQVLFFSVGWAVYAYWVGIGSGKVLLFSLFPVLSNQYWYFTAYFGIFFLIPFFNQILLGSSPRRTVLLGGILFVLFSLLPTISVKNNAVWGVEEGFSVLWLGVLFIFGAILRKLDCENWPWRKEFFLVGYLFFYLLTIGLRFGIGWYLKHDVTLRSLTYNSPLTLFQSLFLFLFFVHWKIQPRNAVCRLIAVTAPICFGVYLFHNNMIAWPYLDICNRFSKTPVIILIPLILGVATGIFFLGGIIDWLRILLFRLFRIPTLAERIGEWSERAAGRYLAGEDHKTIASPQRNAVRTK